MKAKAAYLQKNETTEYYCDSVVRVGGKRREKREEGEARMKQNSLRGNCTLTRIDRIGQE